MIWIAVATALLIAAACCFAVSEWHSQESAYWSHIALLVRLSPALDAKHRPVLRWVQANRPSLRERIRGWRPPPERMSRQEGER